MTEHQTSRSVRAIDRGAIVLGALSAVYLGLRIPIPGGHDPLTSRLLAVIAFLAVIACLALVVWGFRRRSARVRRGARIAALGAALAMAVLAYHPVLAKDRERAQWPPRLEHLTDARIDSMPADIRANWGVRMVAHQMAALGDTATTISIPIDWPMPADVMFALRPDGSSHAQLWARTGDGVGACILIRRSGSGVPDDKARSACPSSTTAPPELAFREPRREPVSAVVPTTDRMAATWAQYRADATRSGSAGSQLDSLAAWTAQVDGEARASASVVGDYVLVGAHRTGTVTALDRVTGETRWEQRLPNWVHQDPVSDGRIVVIGFGDNFHSFTGHAPSGVAAYALADGRHLWSRFDESSVMTSPVITDSVLVYVSAAGVVRKRALLTGNLLGELHLPGGVIMGPPALRGDTLAVALDQAGVCAVLVSTLERLWCRTFPGMEMLGHSAPTIAAGLVITSGPGLLGAATRAEFRAMPLRHQLRVLVTALAPDAIYVGQNFTALSLRDGSTQWQSRFFPFDREVEGHTSGTAAVVGAVGVIVLPFADLVVGFHPTSGEILWTAPARHGRGAPLIVEGRVVLAGRNGVIETRDVITGALLCTTRRPVGYDRSGPTLTGGLVVLANLNGKVEAMPVRTIVGCDATGPAN